MGPNPDPPPALLHMPPTATAPTQGPLAPHWTNYLGVDYAGLFDLVNQMGRYIEAVSPMTQNLAKEINRLISGHRGWYGESASMFRRAYGQDAYMIASVCKMAQVIAEVVSDVVHKLAQLESRLSESLSIGFEQGYFVADDRFYEFKVPGAPKTGPGHVEYVGKLDEFDKLFRECWKQAESIRAEAAAELAVVEATFSEVIKYFRGQNISNALESKGLLNTDQMKKYKPIMDRLVKQAEDQQKKLDGSGVGLADTLEKMKKIGGGAQEVGDLIGSVPALEKYGTSISEVGSAVSTISGLAENWLN